MTRLKQLPNAQSGSSGHSVPECYSRLAGMARDCAIAERDVICKRHFFLYLIHLQVHHQCLEIIHDHGLRLHTAR